jgi:hypothetical protein
MAKITKSEIKQIISEEIARFKKIKSLEEKKSAILESLKQLEEGKKENWEELQKLLDVTTKDNLFDMMWDWQSGDDQEDFLEHAKDELGLSDDEDEDEIEDDEEEMISEGGDERLTNYMFFSNLKQIKRIVEEILSMDKTNIDSILTNGHAWAVDHIATSKDDVEEVYNFLKTETKNVKQSQETGSWDTTNDEKESLMNSISNWMKKEENLNEKKMTSGQKKKREEIVMALKDKMKEFKKRYGARAKDVMYATATKEAMGKK